MTKLYRALLIVFVVLWSGVVSADTGTRLGDRKTTNMAQFHYERATKAADKADTLHNQAVEVAGTQREAAIRKKASKQYNKAITLYQRALRVNQRMPGARSQIAHAHMRLGQYDQAVVVLKEAAELQPGNTDIEQRLAEAQSQAGGSD